MDRRNFMHASLAGLLGARLAPLLEPAAAFAQDAPAAPFSFDAVVARAREMAGLPYRRPLMKLTEPFANLKYDQFRAIRFHDEKRIFADGRPFQLDMMPPGFTFQDKIEINLVSGGVAKPVEFSTDFFDFQPEFFPYPDGRAPPASPRISASAASASATRSTAPASSTNSRCSRAPATSAPWRTALHLRPLRPRPRHRHRRARTPRNSRSSPPSGSRAAARRRGAAA